MKKIFNYSNLFEETVAYDKDTEVLITKCVIPKIQRAYAQGRREEDYVRNNLLEEIFSSLYDCREMDLNFVYGAVHKQDEPDKYTFEVIDGQQRLTTLFLLYWYLGNRELPRESEQYARLVNNLSKFVYETRATATDFCQYLAHFQSYGLVADGETVPAPSVAIKDAKWYFRSFDKDSTIEGMLRMLDAIHDHYEQVLSISPDALLFSNLNNITFYVLSLGEFGLTEELYIKMNARGLPLSPFDNFKAELIGYLRGTEIGNSIVRMDNSIMNAEVPYYLDFSTRMDTRWINIFWNKETPQYDEVFFRFFYRYLANKYAVEAVETLKESVRNDSELKFFANDSESAERYPGFSHYLRQFNEHPEYFQSIRKVLDTFEKYYSDVILPALIPAWDDPQKANAGFFGAPNTFRQTTRVIFYGVTEFIESYEEFRPDVFRKWMRVLWNIVENTNIDNLSKVAALNKSIGNLIHHIANSAKEGVSFYTALSKYRAEDTEEDSDSKERSRIIQEEIIKAGRIAEDEQWESIFVEAEKHPFFKGMVIFFYSKDMTIPEFTHRYEMVRDIFDKDGVTGQYRAEGHLLLRAIISQMKDWKEMFKLNMTDKAETQKYLKHWISANQNIHDLFAMCLDCETHEEILGFLRSLVSESSSLTYYGEEPENIATYRRIHQALYKNRRLQDWIQEHDAYRLVLFKENIFMAKYGSWYSKLMMDTERNKFIDEIAQKYSYTYNWPEQYEVWKEIGYYNCNDVMIKKTVGATELHLVFDNFSEMRLWVKTNEHLQSAFKDEFGIETPEMDGEWLLLARDKYNRQNCFDYLEKTYLRKVENVLDM
ncbi:MAG: DUF262 domain-containing protein [Bacteroidales bacterium]|jgi:hypothetical protein|nr:DUF262 domain-containing protein [Bacteroidales bacterium]MCI2133697.1 DUF262 domain-containing protein [Bacteroidales bacterium]